MSLWTVCDVLVIEKTEPRQHCQTQRSRAWKQQTLLCVRIYERKPVSDDKGQVIHTHLFTRHSVFT